MRSLVSNIVSEDYVVYAELAGVDRRRILSSYVMRNALVPQVTGPRHVARRPSSTAPSSPRRCSAIRASARSWSTPSMPATTAWCSGVTTVSIIGVSVGGADHRPRLPAARSPRAGGAERCSPSCATSCATTPSSASALILVGLVVVLAALSLRLALSAARRLSWCPRTCRRPGAYPFGTTSRGQDVFWQLTVAIRNTLPSASSVAVAEPGAVARDRAALRLQGRLDRPRPDVDQRHLHRHPAVPDPGAVLLRACATACPGRCSRSSWRCLGWAYDARLIRSVAMSLKTREFTQTGVFSGMTTREILMREHLPYVMPIVFSTTMNNMNWSIGLEVTLSVLGFTDINTPTIGGMIYLGQPAHRAWSPASGGGSPSRSSVVVMAVRRPVPARRVDERVHRSAQPAAAHGRGRRGMTRPPRSHPQRPPRRQPDWPGARGRGPQGLLPHAPFRREPGGAGGRRRDASRSARNEIYGLAGESSSGKIDADQDHRRRRCGRRSRSSAARSTFSFLPGAPGLHRATPGRAGRASAGATSPTSCRAP